MEETAVFAHPGDDPHARARAGQLAGELGLPLAEEGGRACWRLRAGRDALSLQAVSPGPGYGAEARLSPDWLALDTTSPAGRRRNQPLLKAVQGRKKRGSVSLILDATAGLGGDDWILASLGYGVVAVERHPIVFALLRDARARAGIERPWAARRIRIHWEDGTATLQGLAEERACGLGSRAGRAVIPRPDVVYLDPMFPEPGRRKGASKKEISMLRGLVPAPEDGGLGMLRLGLLAAHRVVMKRPARREPLRPEGRAPVHSVQGRGFRYDVYIRT
jgi:16S rRNA (guanine1516-N2)-methyltransferase